MASMPDQASRYREEVPPRDVLTKFLKKRPAKSQLEQAHILLTNSPNISGKLAAKQVTLLFAFVIGELIIQ